jgi:hypothetical protein
MDIRTIEVARECRLFSEVRDNTLRTKEHVRGRVQTDPERSHVDGSELGGCG